MARKRASKMVVRCSKTSKKKIDCYKKVIRDQSKGEENPEEIKRRDDWQKREKSAEKKKYHKG